MRVEERHREKRKGKEEMGPGGKEQTRGEGERGGKHCGREGEWIEHGESTERARREGEWRE